MRRVGSIDRRLERVTQGVEAIAEALRDDTALTLARQQEVAQQLEQSMGRLADVIEQFALAVRTIARARVLAAPEPPREEEP
jgi:methyl-accepting chemotaxis protein